ncbi:MAG: glycosyltransferase family 2 protein [bacterium]|nr:glycosyltransferase family 2 protein [bacterium]
MSRPLISVIIPTHSSTTLDIAVKSICKQTYKNLEIIIVGDNPKEETERLAKECVARDSRIKYYRLPHDDPKRFNKRGRNINAGYSARNYGFEKVTGEWITFQDADDASLLNRIEVQYKLALQYNATHLCVDWQQFNPEYLEKALNVQKILKEHSDAIILPEGIITLAKNTKGIIIPILGPLNKYIPFEWKRLRIINKLFFKSLAPYPGTGNSPLFKRSVVEKVRFRALPNRIWPSFTGRGADRDFNFQVAETFKNSYVFKLPLYLWRQNSQNVEYVGYNKYLI